MCHYSQNWYQLLLQNELFLLQNVYLRLLQNRYLLLLQIGLFLLHNAYLLLLQNGSVLLQNWYLLLFQNGLFLLQNGYFLRNGSFITKWVHTDITGVFVFRPNQCSTKAVVISCLWVDACKMK